MFNKLSLQNFKSARELDVPLKQLTVLSGLNGSGKSTVLQSIGLLRQSLEISGKYGDSFSAELENLHLRGPMVQLGEARDVISQRASETYIRISLSHEISPQPWDLSADISGKEDDYVLGVNSSPGKKILEKNTANDVQNQLHRIPFQFLQADRLTPKTHYNRNDATHKNFPFLGIGGEYTPDFLTGQGDKLEVSRPRRCPTSVAGVSEELMKKITATSRLYDQVSGWMQHLSPGVRLRSSDSERINQTDLVTLGFSYASTELAQDSDRRRPANVGFGLTYSLPIVTACLSAPTGALLLLENPEAHLHPRGQAAMGTLLAKCAGDGVQILVETHSDHILNGIRLAVKHNTIKNTAVSLCNFVRDTATGDSYLQNPVILPNGELSAWPDGFFDEWERSLEELLK
ncbi:MAG: DUF3696 domain-containing protein [Rhodoferax sp.]|nr:DUF3696 domain-containing protein [Rhodoferax sp.]